MEHGWSYSGHSSRGGNWHAWAVADVHPQIVASVHHMINTEELKREAHTSRKDAGDLSATDSSFKIAGQSEGSASHSEFLKNRNNFLIVVTNVRIKPGSDSTKTKKDFKGANSWSASAVFCYDVQIWGKP